MREDETSNYIRTILDLHAEKIETITGGLSGVPKYKVFFNKRSWMVKIIELSSERLKWYKALSTISSPGLIVPQIIPVPNSQKVLIISPWVNGIRLDSIFVSESTEMIEEYGRQAALILRQLHSFRTQCNNYRKLLEKKVDDVCNVICQYHLSFPGRNEILCYLREYVNNMQQKKICFLHRDARADNFIIDNGNVFLIDFDSGTIGEPEADFVFFTTMGKEAHRTFAKSVIRTYLDGYDENSFWERNLFYSTLQISEYAIWKWETRKKQMVFQAKNLLEQYDYFHSIIPLWWRKEY